MKESRSKSKELSHKLPSEALKETGMVTPKKNRQVRQETPPTVESTSTASSIQKSFSKRLNMSATSPQKKQIMVGTDEKLQAHQVGWTTNEGCAQAIRQNAPDLTKEEVNDMSYSEKQSTLFGMFSPKQLMSAYPTICTEKGINLWSIDMDANFSSGAKAHKTISGSCDDVVLSNSEASSESDEER